MDSHSVDLKPFQKYAAYGYYVVRKAIPADLVSELASSYYEEAKASREPLLRQNCKYEVNVFDANGFVTSPLLDPQLNVTTKNIEKFKQSILRIGCSAEMLAALQLITLQPRHRLLQIMVFEQSATPAHQDCVYLDTFPPGHLTAA